jgi:glycosyltransferase involved in cell wall biosynthesis
MNKNIGFFTVGFAFNKLVRLRYYEKIFPSAVKIYLITTDKYSSDLEKERKKWDLKRTEVIVLKHSSFNLFQLRALCDKKSLDTLTNLGHPFGALPLLFSSFLRKRKVLLYYLGDVLDIFRSTRWSMKKIKFFFILAPYFLLSAFSDKVAFVGYNSYRKAPYFFLSSRKKFHYLHGPVNTSLFRPHDQEKIRKKLGLDINKPLILYVGRISYLKGGDILSELVRAHPNIEFLAIGKWNESEVPRIKANNLKVIESVENERLSEYYSAADLTFVYNRQGDQLQIVGAESLACGVPILHTKRVHAPNKGFVLRMSDDAKSAQEAIKTFFSLPKKERIFLGKEAREYAIKNLSDEFWKDKYLDFYLK